MEKSFSSKADKMRYHIDQCASGNQTVANYCDEHKLSVATYYYWHKKFQHSKPVDDRFIELHSVHSSFSCVEVILSNGVQLRFDQLVPVNYLKELCYI